jgi:hypothetical protein
MEPIMSNNIVQSIVAAAIALAVTIASIGVIGSAVAQSPVDPIAPETLVNRDESPASETDFRLGDHQQLRRIFLSN